jgi:hypothetical protein
MFCRVDPIQGRDHDTASVPINAEDARFERKESDSFSWTSWVGFIVDPGSGKFPFQGCVIEHHPRREGGASRYRKG